MWRARLDEYRFKNCTIANHIQSISMVLSAFITSSAVISPTRPPKQIHVFVQSCDGAISQITKLQSFFSIFQFSLPPFHPLSRFSITRALYGHLTTPHFSQQAMKTIRKMKRKIFTLSSSFPLFFFSSLLHHYPNRYLPDLNNSCDKLTQPLSTPNEHPVQKQI